ncbi:O-methylsterigmatocystin oxidoreductase [Leucoagaricus sp. SymC.cos]|nr:O-methylsterigmatocystin oxidoreductase [Leucoagaricus sp. SymC.cos]
MAIGWKCVRLAASTHAYLLQGAWKASWNKNHLPRSPRKTDYHPERRYDGTGAFGETLIVVFKQAFSTDVHGSVCLMILLFCGKVAYSARQGWIYEALLVDAMHSKSIFESGSVHALGLLSLNWQHFELSFIGGVSTSVTYGLPVQRRDDPVVRYTEKALLDGNNVAAPGKYLVNIIPQLKYVPEWMPGAHFKKVAREVREELDELMNRPYKESLNSIVSPMCSDSKEMKPQQFLQNAGTARESFVSTTLERYRDKPDFDLQALYTKQTAVQVFAAASETSGAAITTFILAMLTHPDVQRLTQKEIDSVVGRDSLPDFWILSISHTSQLLSRSWHPIVPAGVPHLTSDEDVYEGYYIPKNCIITPNTYAMLHDEDVFPDPEEFRPSRFLRSDGTIRDDLPDPENIASFGFGRRICPGREIALSMLHITAVSILHLFDIRPALDDNGHPINVKPKFFAASLISNPVPFRCKITPRGGIDVESLLQEYSGTDPM